MRWHLEFAIRWLFLCILQGSFTTSENVCSNTTYSYSSDGNSLKMLIKDINIMPTDCSCDLPTDPGTLTCSFYICSPCALIGTVCALSPCSCVKVNVVDLTISPTCISTTITRIYCLLGLPVVSGSCQISTKSLLRVSTKPKSCRIEKKNEDDTDLNLTIQSVKIDGDDKTPEQAFEDGDCTAITVSPNASNTTLAPATSISDTTTARIEYRPSTESTPKPETTGRSSPTLLSGPMIMNMTTEPLQDPSMMSYDSAKDIGIGVGVGVGGGILLIIAIIVVILIFRRRQAESHKLHDNDATQSSAAAAAVAAAPSEASYESYRVPVLAPYDNATNGVTASGYQTITYDNEPIGEYTEIKEAEEASDHNGYDECRIGRNEVYSMYHKTGNDLDKVSENTSMNIENETTVIDNDLYG